MCYKYTHTMEYSSAIKKKEILPFATWIYLETTMLSEISHQKDKYCMVTLIWESSKKYTYTHKNYFRDFPGDPVVKTLCFYFRGPMFDPWSEN